MKNVSVEVPTSNDNIERKARLEREWYGKNQHQLETEQHSDWVAYREKGVDGRDYPRLKQQIRWRGRIIYGVNRSNQRTNQLSRDASKRDERSIPFW
jgi:hypothetical protein